MQSPIACGRTEGAFAQPNPQYQLSNPPYPTLSGQAASGGVIQGRFAWRDPDTGYVGNAQVAGASLGIVIPEVGWRATWGKVFYDPTVCAVRIRQYLPVTLGVRGPYWVRFLAGAYGGSPVYADNVDGHAISGEASNATLTPWTVTTQCMPGGLAIINTSAKFGGQ